MRDSSGNRRAHDLRAVTRAMLFIELRKSRGIVIRLRAAIPEQFRNCPFDRSW